MTMTTVKQVVSVKPTDLRMNDAYIFYYNNLAKLIITGIVPFVALCVFNTKVKIHTCWKVSKDFCILSSSTVQKLDSLRGT